MSWMQIRKLVFVYEITINNWYSRFAAEAQQIEHEHDDEHEHDFPKLRNLELIISIS